MKLKNDFEYYLQTVFDSQGEYCEIPITKNNCEYLYERWSENLDIQEIIDYANEFGAKLAEQIIDEAYKIADSAGDMTSKTDEKIRKTLTTKYLKN